jgi:A/G-specific adenine glycosylase
MAFKTSLDARAGAAAALLAWYDRHRRDLPWRALPGEPADPYKVWLSEIMLQQTTVTAVKPYFLGFLARWPTVGLLAQASGEEVMRAWAGLGYYSRARNLHACAKMVAGSLKGKFPDTEAGLLAFPVLGPIPRRPSRQSLSAAPSPPSTAMPSGCLRAYMRSPRRCRRQGPK